MTNLTECVSGHCGVKTSSNGLLMVQSRSPFSTVAFPSLSTSFPPTFNVFFEIIIVEIDEPKKENTGVVQLGYSLVGIDKDEVCVKINESLNEGVGDVKGSWGYNIFTKKLLIEGEEEVSAATDDTVSEDLRRIVVGCGMNENGIKFFRGDKIYEIPLKDIGRSVVPCVSAEEGVIFELNFGEREFETIPDEAYIGVLNSVRVNENPANVVESKEEVIPMTRINLDDIEAEEELHKYDLEMLKYNLQERGLKCGGTLQQRAERLFKVKGLKEEEYPKALKAKRTPS